MRKVLIALMFPLALTACKKGEKATVDAETETAVKEIDAETETAERVPLVNEEKVVQCEEEDCFLVERMRAALRDNDRQALSRMFSYPLRMRVPVPTLKNGDDFLKHYDGIFDERLIEILRDSPYEKWEEVGWRGRMIESGAVWINAGKITALNYCGPACEQDRDVIHDSANPGLIAAFAPVEEESTSTVYYLYAKPEKEYLLMAFEENHAAEEPQNTIYLLTREAPKKTDKALVYTFYSEGPVYELSVGADGGEITTIVAKKRRASIKLERVPEPWSPFEM